MKATSVGQRLPALVEALARALARRRSPRTSGRGTPARLSRTSSSTLRVRRGVVGSRGEHRAAERDDARRPGRDGVRRDRAPASRRGCARRCAPASRAAARSTSSRRLELGGGVEGAADVDVDRASGRCGSPARAAPGDIGAQRGVAGQEAGHQDHRRRLPHGGVARRTAPAPRRRRAPGAEGEPAGLGQGAGLAQHGAGARGGEALGRQPRMRVVPIGSPSRPMRLPRSNVVIPRMLGCVTMRA